MSLKIFLTFDCEDFINHRSMLALNRILKLLHKYNIKGLFFFTGHMAEKISFFPKLIDLLEDEEIGYHSSAHSVRPTIIEYTDVKDYELARQISVEREVKHVNPITGEIEGKGGIIFLRNLFPSKKIISFRAPGFSFSPPHLDALKELGIRFDFSTDLSQRLIEYKKLTFYPYPKVIDIIKPSSYRSVFISLIKYHLAVLDFHPNHFINKYYWDSIYFSGNPKKLIKVEARNYNEFISIFKKFELFLKRLSYLEKKKVFEITPNFEIGEKKEIFTMKCVTENYIKSIKWAKKFFRYQPIFILDHFFNFFSSARE